MPKFVSIDNSNQLSASIKIIGVGGGGCNFLETMINSGFKGVEYVAINTDAQVLEKSSANHKLQIGRNLTRGLGSGADPRIGKKAAEESKEDVLKILESTDLVFVVAGMGGGTGSGASPVISSLAKLCGSLVIGIVTIPFRWEGKRRQENAIEATNELRKFVDSLIVIENEKLIHFLDKSVSAAAVFNRSNEVIFEATRVIAQMVISNVTMGIADIITIPGIINVDFADIRAVMYASGDTVIGFGMSSGKNRATEAAKKAISSPFLEGVNLKEAKNILLNVSGSSSLSMQEIDEGNQIIYAAAGENANIIFGWVNKEDMKEYVSYAIIATGFSKPVQSENLNIEISTHDVSGVAFNKLWDKGFKVNDNDNLNVPTIFRVKGTNKKQVAENLKINKLEKENDSIEEVTKDSDEDIDSSSFLRMIMD